ncbi:MAG: SprT family zinc-dependent metalloprotease [Ruminococcus sp.]|nr:SprT family zinc-dependent metalloprotease [Ruminococcus sp.]
MSRTNTYIITNDGERVDFTLDVSDRKRWALAAQEGRLIVRVSRGYNAARVREFIESNLGWIHSAIDRTAEKSGLPQKYEDGEVIRLLGERLTVSFVNSDRYFKPEISEGKLLVSVCPQSDKAYAAGEIGRFIFSLAEKEVRESMDRLTKITGLVPKKVTLKSMTASWGRCSSDGNISINYKVVTYSKRHIDYVCIHELAHLKYMNHSGEFWALVEKYCPDWREIRKSMR